MCPELMAKALYCRRTCHRYTADSWFCYKHLDSSEWVLKYKTFEFSLLHPNIVYWWSKKVYLFVLHKVLKLFLWTCNSEFSEMCAEQDLLWSMISARFNPACGPTRCITVSYSHVQSVILVIVSDLWRKQITLYVGQ